jgi:hypothetical protein
MDVMIDIETLGTKPGCVVLQVAGLAFNRSEMISPPGNVTTETFAKMDRFNAYILPASQAKYELKADLGTLQWHLNLPRTALIRACSEGKDIADVLREFYLWIAEHLRHDYEGMIWCRGTDFDPPILEETFKRVGMPTTPWQYWQKQDLRTLLGTAFGALRQKPIPILEGTPLEELQGQEHNALDDCIRQTVHYHIAMQMLFYRQAWPLKQPSTKSA